MCDCTPDVSTVRMSEINFNCFILHHHCRRDVMYLEYQGLNNDAIFPIKLTRTASSPISHKNNWKKLAEHDCKAPSLKGLTSKSVLATVTIPGLWLAQLAGYGVSANNNRKRNGFRENTIRISSTATSALKAWPLLSSGNMLLTGHVCVLNLFYSYKSNFYLKQFVCFSFGPVFKASPSRLDHTIYYFCLCLLW